MRSAAYDASKDMYATDLVFGEIWEAPTVINHTPFFYYTIRDGWLYKLNQLRVPQSDNRLFLVSFLICEAHAFSWEGILALPKPFSIFKATSIGLPHPSKWNLLLLIREAY